MRKTADKGRAAKKKKGRGDKKLVVHLNRISVNFGGAGKALKTLSSFKK